MKEMTIEEKAKAYDEAIERAKILYNDKNEIGYANAESVLEEVFPLLKESEDEMVRKCLINGMKFYYEDNEEATWGTEKFSMKVKDILSWLEKQGKGKLTDKPKFKVGDWITDDEDEAIFHITSYDIDYGYQLETVNGTSFHYSDETIEKKYRLWTIQDAKDGDVLINGDFPCIFKRCDDNGSLYVYCGINAHNDFSILSEDPENVWDDYSKQYFPATKEQRDLLFTKMEEAGYEWDSEKKELKKIEQKEVIHNELTKFEKAVKQVMEEAIECGDTHNLKADADMLLRLVHNSSWSEEDEKMMNSFLHKVEVCDLLTNKENVWIINKLKSLKQRCVWKPSDEQMKQLGWIAEQNKDNMIGKELISLYQDLKKLREG